MLPCTLAFMKQSGATVENPQAEFAIRNLTVKIYKINPMNCHF